MTDRLVGSLSTHGWAMRQWPAREDNWPNAPRWKEIIAALRKEQQAGAAGKLPPIDAATFQAIRERLHQHDFRLDRIPTVTLHKRNGWSPGWALSAVPVHCPPRRRLAVLSSAAGKSRDFPADWFVDLRDSVRNHQRAGGMLVSIPGTAAHKPLCHLARRFACPLLQIRVGKQKRVVDWLDDLATQPMPDSNFRHWTADVSPCLFEKWESNRSANHASADALLVQASDAVLLLASRAGGRIESLLQWMNDRSVVASSTWKIPSPDCLSAHTRVVAESFASSDLAQITHTVACRAKSPSSSQHARNDVRHSAAEGWLDGLCHWTRRCPGPWPGQPESDYWDDLIWQRAAGDHSAFGTLKRIVRERKLRASSRLIRGAWPCVSFTACPPESFSTRRVFRAHLQRWDFEGTGICIDRQLLESQGARPVIYGDESKWRVLSAADRPFFQKEQTQSRQGALIDWSEEQEWRLPADLDLAQIPHKMAYLFVSNAVQAGILAGISPWPIRVLSE